MRLLLDRLEEEVRSIDMHRILCKRILSVLSPEVEVTVVTVLELLSAVRANAPYTRAGVAVERITTGEV